MNDFKFSLLLEHKYTMSEKEELKAFLAFLGTPEESAARLVAHDVSGNGSSVLRETCALLFRRIEVLAKTLGSLKNAGDDSILSGLDELYTGTEDERVDVETLWGQVDLQNSALHTILRQSLKKLSNGVRGKGNKEIRILEDVEESDVEKESAKVSNDHDDSDGRSDDDDNISNDDDSTARIQARMDRAMADMEDDGTSDGDDDDQSENLKKDRGALREEDDLVDPAAEVLNDGFFDIHEMEAFADEEEEFLPDEAFGTRIPEKDDTEEDKRTFHQKQRDGDLGEGSEEDDTDDDDEDPFQDQPSVKRKKYRTDDEVEALYTLYGKPQSDSDDVAHLTAADLFGTPNKKYLEQRKAKIAAGEIVSTEKDGDEDSWNDYSFDQEGGGASAWHNEDERMDDEEEGETEAAVEEKGSSDRSAITSKKMDKLSKQTELLEKEMLAEKPWQMTGETTSASRPVNSLLESTPEFETATKMAPVITAEHTENLEETIKRRILAEDWDDVIPRELPDVGWHQKRGEKPEVSQEKSKLGLGELYEREYLKKAVGYDVDTTEKETEEEKAKNEMKTLFANLCSKLDALSNYHFAPRPIADEAEVKPVTQPAIAMEEVLPLHVSDARGAAPEEVYGAKRGRDGILRADSELDQQDRKRLRSSKKAARRKARKEKLADEKLISRLQPGLGLNNPYEKRKMREELSMARGRGKVTTGEADSTEYGASGTFFKRMQEEAEKTIKGGNADLDNDETKKRRRTKSSALKL